ncbi:chromosomal replication initiator protein DnaA [Bifidobacterium actinocoloniiforme DSM 22766]|uniref:Chromosomal replication initiator protein DnaA n=1 Tax=Bifidobacterium actinocoloniiforme DSM 22766 TaxID=1437605 RepID=A0A086Z2N7_9BIFI|nr:chromosomal replication initiator protein DnaA [Bifidobacterium actinocoloniiforme]AKV55756.1 hypothetical protein AB656_05770 [Bifidobacterium actinocoloniiforme DSM 22766]KFI40787.1 chromosomal replication initiator protein DnaA [Bifidobacterium actinocoloniiforme DSM 22766]
MADDQQDPAQQARSIWQAASQALAFSATLTARDKGWLADITPEAVFGNTIVLSVSSRAAQTAIQGDLGDTLVKALNLVSGKDMIPAIKIVRDRPAQAEAAPQEAPGPAAPVQASGHDQAKHQARQSDRSQPAAQDEARAQAERTAQTSDPNPPAQVTQNQTAQAPQTPESLHRDENPDERAHRSAQDSPTEQTPEAEHRSYRQQTFAEQSDSNQQDFTPPTFPMGTNQVERDPETHLNKSATFATFVPGDSNRFARTVAMAVAEGSGQDFNPLCIYGASGLGKTHLLNAIGNYALVKDPGLKVRYVTSEEFTNEFIEALQDPNRSQGQIAAFNRRYRQVDVLLIDDIQFLGGKDATLEQFFHTFNALHDANKRIVIASDVAPKNLKGFEERLISRFDSGMPVDIKPPDRETRVAILRMLAGTMGIAIPNEVFDLIAERFTENIRELEGALTRVTAVASLNNQPVTQTLAEQTLQDYFATDVEIKPTDIISQVAKYFHLTFDDLVGRTRTKNIAMARQIAMYLAREMTSMSLVDIGEVFGGRDHTTVMHAYTRISNEMQEKREIYNYVMELTVRLKQPQND